MKHKLILVLIALLLTGCSNSDDCQTATDNSSGAYGLFSGNIPVKTALAGSAYQHQLESCAYYPGRLQCNFNTLPLLGMEKSNPSTNDILQRTLVTHDWMADRFEELLNQYPATMHKMFRGVTAIIIASDIRPAFYTTRTGAIYLDSHYFWKTQEEKADIDTTADFRSGFGNDLQYFVPNRYVKNGQRAYPFYSLDSTEERSLDDIKFFLARLLIHELAHANDFFPPNSYSSIDRSKDVYTAAGDRVALWVSEQMQTNHSLTANTLKQLANVNFRGECSTAAQRALTATDIGDLLKSDLANDDYNYLTAREDLAMLAEEAMMQHMFDIQRDVAALDFNNIIGWGSRKRVAKDEITNKVKFIFDRLLPNEDLSAFYSGLGNEQPLASGTHWNSHVTSTKSSQKSTGSHQNHDDYLRLYD